MDFFQSFIGDVGVYLGRRDGSVAEHRLDRADIGAIHEEVGRETVSESMRVYIFHDASLFRVVFYDPGYGSRR